MKSDRIQRFRLGGSSELPVFGYHFLYDAPVPALHDIHYELEFGLVLRGCVRRYLCGRHRDLAAGDVWLCGIWEPHGCEIRKYPSEIVGLTIWPQMLINLRVEEFPSLHWMAPFTLPVAKRLCSPENLRDQFTDLGQRMASLAKSRSPLWKVRLRFLLCEALTMLMEAYEIREIPRPERSGVYGWVNQAIDRALESRRFLPVRQVAKEMGLSRQTFNSYFKQVMGVDFADFAFHCRLHGAVTQLLQSDNPVKMIAGEWGFTDASHFHRNMLVHYQCTPTEYRNRFKE